MTITLPVPATPSERTLRRRAEAARAAKWSELPAWCLPRLQPPPMVTRTVLLAGWQAPIPGFAASMRGQARMSE